LCKEDPIHSTSKWHPRFLILYHATFQSDLTEVSVTNNHTAISNITGIAVGAGAGGCGSGSSGGSGGVSDAPMDASDSTDVQFFVKVVHTAGEWLLRCDTEVTIYRSIRSEVWRISVNLNCSPPPPPSLQFDFLG
jgi:hypothetical protein